MTAEEKPFALTPEALAHLGQLHPVFRLPSDSDLRETERLYATEHLASAEFVYREMLIQRGACDACAAERDELRDCLQRIVDGRDAWAWFGQGLLRFLTFIGLAMLIVGVGAVVDPVFPAADPAVRTVEGWASAFVFLGLFPSFMPWRRG